MVGLSVNTNDNLADLDKQFNGALYTINTHI